MSSEFSTTCRISFPIDILSTFGDRLKEAFGTREIAELARKLGITYQAAKNYVEGRLPSPEKLIDISRSTNCSIDWLLTGVGEKVRADARVASEDVLIRRVREIVRDELSKSAALPGEVEPIKSAEMIWAPDMGTVTGGEEAEEEKKRKTGHRKSGTSR